MKFIYLIIQVIFWTFFFPLNAYSSEESLSCHNKLYGIELSLSQKHLAIKSFSPLKSLINEKYFSYKTLENKSVSWIIAEHSISLFFTGGNDGLITMISPKKETISLNVHCQFQKVETSSLAVK